MIRKIEYPIGKHGDVRDFVSKTVFDIYKSNAKWFVSDNIVRLYDFIHEWFNNYYKAEDSNTDYVLIKVNDWYYGGSFNNRGLRTVQYIMEQIAIAKKNGTGMPALISQHIGGSTNAIDFNVIVFTKDGKSRLIDSNIIYDLILKNEKVFISNGLTTLEDKKIATTWTHGDCRFTGLETIYIVKPI